MMGGVAEPVGGVSMQDVRARVRRQIERYLVATGAGGGSTHLALAQDATPRPAPNPAEVLNYLLSLGYLERALYRDGLEAFDADAFAALGYRPGVRNTIAAIADHEQHHVDALAAMVADQGGEPAAEGANTITHETLAEFLATAAALEEIGVAAYGGAAQYFSGAPELMTAVLAVHGADARHAAYLNLVTGSSPFPTAFEVPQTRQQVEDAAEALQD
jgi:hypothetical protein